MVLNIPHGRFCIFAKLFLLLYLKVACIIPIRNSEHMCPVKKALASI